jgi:type II secretory pathway pseudopilin PulG
MEHQTNRPIQSCLAVLLVLVLAVSGAVPALAQGSNTSSQYSAQQSGAVAADFLRQFLFGSGDPAIAEKAFAEAPLLPTDGSVTEQAFSLRNLAKTGFTHPYFAYQKTETKDVYRIVVVYAGYQNKLYFSPTNTCYNTADKFLFGEDEEGVFGTGYDYMPLQYVFRHAQGHVPVKIGGYSKLYDIFAPVAMIFIDTRRIIFDYEGKEWLVQLWKGSYFVVEYGGEIGIYNRPIGSKGFYQASDELIDMEYSYAADGKQLIEYLPTKTWWGAAFRISSPIFSKIYSADELTMTGKISFDDPGMLKAFAAAFAEQKPANTTGSVTGKNSFEFVWG